ncbi:glycine cleavage system aminomethyltransferase GcvT [Nocardioides bigeumensis]|uniref:Aminomethyltransferase n=1 Tax=Nocardioides bigeumensis TaxID=433657 RepID=A0ABN2YPP4_9ACTN
MTHTSTPTALHDVHTGLGATLTDFAGWSMPLKYGSETAEHHAVRNAAGIFDLSHMGELEIRGSRADRALDYALVGKPSDMRVGQARYSMLVSSSGGILDDVVVYRLGTEHFLVVANASNVSTVHAELVERVADYACEVHDASTAWALIAVQGPRSAGIVADAADDGVATLRYYSIARASIHGQEALVARTGYTGEDGFEIYCPATAAADVWARLTEVGTPRGMIPAGLACRDSLRLEAGMPLYGKELTVDVNPFEVGLGRVVRFDKEDGFVGDDALAEARDRGPVRQLVGLTSRGRRAPRTGYDVLATTGEAVGQVTSGAPSPTLGHPVAMALVDARSAKPATYLAVDIRGRTEPVEVVTLPFYKRAD